MIRALSAWGPAVGWAAVLFLLSEWQPARAPDVSGVDKAGHLLLYGVLGAALARGGREYGIPLGSLLVLGALYGAADEWHQSFTGRDPSFFDWLADVAGVGAGLLLASRRGSSGTPEEAGS